MNASDPIIPEYNLDFNNSPACSTHRAAKNTEKPKELSRKAVFSNYLDITDILNARAIILCSASTNLAMWSELFFATATFIVSIIDYTKIFGIEFAQEYLFLSACSFSSLAGWWLTFAA